MTRMISNHIPELAGISVPESEREDMEDKLIEYMYSVDPEFTRRKILVKKDKKTKKVVSDNLSVYYSGYGKSGQSIYVCSWLAVCRTRGAWPAITWKSEDET